MYFSLYWGNNMLKLLSSKKGPATSSGLMGSIFQWSILGSSQGFSFLFFLDLGTCCPYCSIVDICANIIITVLSNTSNWGLEFYPLSILESSHLRLLAVLLSCISFCLLLIANHCFCVLLLWNFQPVVFAYKNLIEQWNLTQKPLSISFAFSWPSCVGRSLLLDSCFLVSFYLRLSKFSV